MCGSDGGRSDPHTETMRCSFPDEKRKTIDALATLGALGVYTVLVGILNLVQEFVYDGGRDRGSLWLALPGRLAPLFARPDLLPRGHSKLGRLFLIDSALQPR